MKIAIFSILPLVLAAMSGHGAGLLVTYSFDGAAGNEASLAPDAQPANGSAADISRGSGLTPSPAANAFSSSGWATGGSLDADDYYSLTIAPNSGYLLNLTRVETDERRSGTGIRSWEVRSSLDNYTSPLTIFNVPDNTDTRTDLGVDLPAAFASLSSGVTFRFYGYSSEASGGTWRVDNVQLSGEITPVPEPAQAGLMCAGGLFFICGMREWRRIH
jgi:hypothetical protein